ncbi:hypothetical protein V6N12_010714 [Hibiscus sabdariffa]|uniref:Uncharacterized protein n=1 Tax=Hibiscus sabdariffa TaxID=183260 RepID=A0ABR2EL78_9ROSI
MVKKLKSGAGVGEEKTVGDDDDESSCHGQRRKREQLGLGNQNRLKLKMGGSKERRADEINGNEIVLSMEASSEENRGYLQKFLSLLPKGASFYPHGVVTIK